MIGYPSEEWRVYLIKLSKVVKQFSGEHEKWYQLGIIKNLVVLFKYEYASLGLSSIAAAILADIFYFNQ